MTSSSDTDCLCSIISTALELPRINIPSNTEEDHVCLTAMDFPNDWQSDQTFIVPDPWPEVTDTPINVPLSQDQDQDQDQDLEESQDIMGLALDWPKPAPLSSWTGSHFNKPIHVVCQPTNMLMPQKEIDETRNFELYRLHSVSFELSQGDTLVFIDYPVHHKGVLNHTDCHGIIYKSQQFRVHSSKLLETGSSKFADMLGPTYQFRIQRRRKMVNKMPEGIKYLLDLTPPSEGDDLVFQMTELSLTPGIIKWWSSSLMNDVDPWLVCGHDDVCMCNRLPKASADDKEQHDSTSPTKDNPESPLDLTNPTENGQQKPSLPIKPEFALQMKARNENEHYETPPYRHIPDYCPIRHRNGIVRLLMLIEGKGVILDSATRLWTLVKLGNIFDCGSILRDRVTQWIMHGQNITFVEVLPEEALQIAFSLQIPQITENAFRILVNELALKLAADTKPNPHVAQTTTIFGRKLGDLPDELDNLVQHAAQALVERVSDINAMMRNPRLFDFWDIEEWKKLRWLEQMLEKETSPLSQSALNSLRLLMKALYFEVGHMWDDVMTTPPTYNHETYISIDQDRLTYVEPKDFEKATIIMQDFNSVQMLLCAAPYNDLGVLLDGRRYRNSRCTLSGYKQRTYRTLLDDTTNAVRFFLTCVPRESKRSLWASIFPDELFPTMGVGRPLSNPMVSLDALEAGVKKGLRPITLSWLRHDIEPPLNITRHLLLTLTDNELKFLPLWAGGCDDGTGGVFEDPIPSTEMGPNGPGPAYHTGHTIPSAPSSITGSMVEDMDQLRVWGSTTGASINVHDSISTVYRQDQVIADDKSIASESFTMGGSDDYANARFAIPADHQDMGEAVNMTVETTDSESTSATEGWNSTNDDSDDDVYMFDSDDSTDTIS